MAWRKRKLHFNDSVCLAHDPRHLGHVMAMFKCAKYGWTANVLWETGAYEYVPMRKLIHAEE